MGKWVNWRAPRPELHLLHRRLLVCSVSNRSPKVRPCRRRCRLLVRVLVLVMTRSGSRATGSARVARMHALIPLGSGLIERPISPSLPTRELLGQRLGPMRPSTTLRTDLNARRGRLQHHLGPKSSFFAVHQLSPNFNHTHTTAPPPCSLRFNPTAWVKLASITQFVSCL